MMRRMTMLASPRVESCHRMLEMLEKSSVRVFRIPVREANKYFTSKMLLVNTLNQSILQRVPNNKLDCLIRKNFFVNVLRCIVYLLFNAPLLEN